MKINWIQKKQFWHHSLFWVILLLYYISSNWTFYEHKIALIERFSIKTVLQILLSYFIIGLLIPKFLNRNRRLLFGGIGLMSVYAAYVIYTLIRYYYFDPKYYGLAPKFDLSERVFNISFYFNELSWFIFPVIILVAFQYYRNQQEIVELRAEKKTTELNLLKKQLNPHFLFNTLNNLYTLALKKSDKTPEVIGKLSAILDHMLYHCEEQYVSLNSEIRLLKNYIDLEKIRYSNRLDIRFDYDIEEGIRVAPLLFLTFLENAFKHGVKEELDIAKIRMKLMASKQAIQFELQNSKPVHQQQIANSNKAALGLKNIQKQLRLLYPDCHELVIKEDASIYSIHLTLKLDEL